MKKLFLFLLTILLPMVASADAVEIDGIYYNLISKAKVAEVVSSPNKYKGDVKIPDKVTYEEVEYTVTAIVDKAFFECEGLTSILMPHNLESIGDHAFWRCSNLTSLNIPNNVVSIGIWAFYGCNKITSVSFGNKIKKIGEEAFKDCKEIERAYITDVGAWCNIEFGYIVDGNGWYTEDRVYRSNPLSYGKCKLIVNNQECKDLEIPEGVTQISDGAFYNYRSLLSVKIPNSVEIIGSFAFESCVSLNKINIPENVKRLGKYTFKECSSLTNISISNNIEILGEYTFAECSSLQNIVFPSSILSISTGAFYKCANLTNVTFNNGVRFIENRAFAGCTSLCTVDIPNSVERIGKSAFEGCSELSSVTIPNSVSQIWSDAFSKCSKLTSIDIPNSLKEIEDGTFSGCGIKILTIPDNVNTIGKYAFSGCAELTTINWGTGVKKVGLDAFKNCNSLKAVNISDLEKWCTTNLGEYQPLVYANHLYLNNEEIIDLVIPSSVSKIESFTFYGCKSIKTITIPKSVKSIGSSFINCPEIKDVYCYAEDIPETSYTAFYDSYINYATLHVPSGTVDLYKAATPWKDFGSIVEMPKAKYQLTYYIDGEEYKTYEYEEGENITVENWPTKEGYTFSGWSDIPATMPANDVTVTGTFTVNKYKLTYSVDGEEYKSYDVEYGSTITSETEPTKEGYTFSGWSEIPATMPAKDVTVTGTFTVNKYKLTYSVDGEEYKSYDIEYGSTITSETEPTKEGYTFSGWSDLPETMPAKDVTVTGTFTVNKYKLTYSVDGEEYKSYDIEYGSTITSETEPTKEGYTFSGWSDIPKTMPANDVTVTGTFTINKYKVTYMIDGEVYQTVEVEYGSTITPPNPGDREGYDFAWGDYPSTMPAEDITINGSYTATDIKAILSDESDVKIYNVSGKPLNSLQKGVNILRYKDGRTQKLIIK